MSQAQNIILSLRRLASLETDERKSTKQDSKHAALMEQIDALRGLLPTSILGHHDRLKARGKPSVAAVSHGVCGWCHLTIPCGRLADLRRTADALNVCDNCGVFVYLADEGQPTAHIKVPEPKKETPKKRRPRATRKQVLAGQL